LATLGAAGCSFRTISGAVAWGGVSGRQAGGENQATNGSQKQKLPHCANPFLNNCNP
jgi:hypothetical protein